jgi:glucosamine--fructose-6-phosphate aminotransferase (isomerizing)
MKHFLHNAHNNPIYEKGCINMCGIIGYNGPRKAMPLLIDGLKKLEYRGYDSAGIALMEKEGICTFKKEGKVAALEGILPAKTTATLNV